MIIMMIMEEEGYEGGIRRCCVSCAFTVVCRECETDTGECGIDKEPRSDPAIMIMPATGL